MGNELLDGLATHANKLCVHLVALNLFTLHRFESTSTHMKGEFLAIDTMGIDIGQYLGGEMQSCCGSCHRTLNLGIYCLIGGLVALLGFSIQVWRNRQFAHSVDDFCETHIPIPGKIDAMRCAMNRPTRSLNVYCFLFNVYCPCEGAFFPFLQVAHQTIPSTMTCGLEHEFVIGRLSRFQEEHLDQGTCLFAEVHACLDHLGVVEHHQGTLGQIIGQMIKNIFPYLTLAIDKQLGVVTLGDGKLGNTLIRERIIIVANTDMSWIGNHRIHALRSANATVQTKTMTGMLQSTR